MLYMPVFCVDILLLIIVIKYVQKEWKQVMKKLFKEEYREVRNATKTLKQVADIEHNAPVFLIHLVQLHNKVDQGCRMLYVGCQ